jgi:hypothetical protein
VSVSRSGVGANVGDVAVRAIQTGEKSSRIYSDRPFDQPSVTSAEASESRSITISDGLRKLVEG